MIEVKVEWNFDPDDMERLLLGQIKQSLSERIASVQCPVHGQHPRVTVTASSLEQMDFHVEGCCDDLVNSAIASLQDQQA